MTRMVVTPRTNSMLRRATCSPPPRAAEKPASRQKAAPLTELYELKNVFTSAKYARLYEQALLERLVNGVGTSARMNGLYRLWSYRLRDEFDAAAYLNFHRLAQEDNTAGYSYGVECLFRFYSYGLEVEFRASLYEDFERAVLAEYRQGGLYGLEKLWAFVHFKGLPPGSSVRVCSELAELLATRFTSIDDFRKAQPTRGPSGGSFRGASPVLLSCLQPTVTAGSSPLSSAASQQSCTVPLAPGLGRTLAANRPHVPAKTGAKPRRRAGHDPKRLPAESQSTCSGAAASLRKAAIAGRQPRPEARETATGTCSAASGCSGASPRSVFSASWKSRLNWESPGFVPAQHAAPASALSVPVKPPDSVATALAAAARLASALPARAPACQAALGPSNSSVKADENSAVVPDAAVRREGRSTSGDAGSGAAPSSSAARNDDLIFGIDLDDDEAPAADQSCLGGGGSPVAWPARTSASALRSADARQSGKALAPEAGDGPLAAGSPEHGTARSEPLLSAWPASGDVLPGGVTVHGSCCGQLLMRSVISQRAAVRPARAIGRVATWEGCAPMACAHATHDHTSSSPTEPASHVGERRHGPPLRQALSAPVLCADDALPSNLPLPRDYRSSQALPCEERKSTGCSQSRCTPEGPAPASPAMRPLLFKQAGRDSSEGCSDAAPRGALADSHASGLDASVATLACDSVGGTSEGDAKLDSGSAAWKSESEGGPDASVVRPEAPGRSQSSRPQQPVGPPSGKVIKQLQDGLRRAQADKWNLAKHVVRRDWEVANLQAALAQALSRADQAEKQIRDWTNLGFAGV